MNDNIKTQVIDLLENTYTRLRDIALLRYELQHRARVSANEMIDVLVFGHGDGSSHVAGAVSDKTMRVAFDFERKTEEANAEIAGEIISRLASLEYEQERLDKYISFLDGRQIKVLKELYYERKLPEQIASYMGVSAKTVRRIKVAAVDCLCDMFEVTDTVRLK